MLAWCFGFWMWRLTLACRVLFLLFAENSVVMCGVCPGTFVTWPWLWLSMIYCCKVSYLRHWSQICITSRSCWFPDLAALSWLLCQSKMPRTWGMAAYIQDGYGAFRQSKFECGCCEMLVFRMWCDTAHLCVVLPHPWPKWQIFNWFLIHASFLFVGDLNDHHRDWLGSTTMNRHGVAAFDFTTVSSCNQLVVSPKVYITTGVSYLPEL